MPVLRNTSTERRFYVYTLSDPRNGQTFYVGKGQRDRLMHHEREARRGIHSRKCQRIREIWESGFEVQRAIVARFEVSAEAYEAERALIESIGLANLTNVLPGGIIADYVRARGKRRQPWTVTGLKRIAPGLRKCLALIDTFGAVFVAGHNVTDAVISIARSARQDCGPAAFRAALKG